MQAAPTALARPIRSLCWMLRVEPPAILAPPKKPRPPPAPKAAPKTPAPPPPKPPAWMPKRTRWTLAQNPRLPKNRLTGPPPPHAHIVPFT